MRTTIRNLMAAMLLVAASTQTHAQGLVYDQQSATSPASPIGNGNVDGVNIQTTPLTQSFIPTLSTIDFVQFEFEDVPGNGNNGATVYVNLWTGSPSINSATLLGSTAPVYMPNGFVNNGLGVAGVTNFYFSTPIALTSGQTYYLQPVVQSGDNPWDIVALDYDAYSNGELYGNGLPSQPTIDLWFTEGIVAVPEPSTLALVGLGSLLVVGFKRRSKLVVPLLLAASVLSVQAAPDSVVQATADAAGLSRVSATTLLHTGTFWVTTVSPDGDLMALPYPFLPSNLSALPTYSVVNDIFIVDDTGGQIMPSASRMSSAEATATVQAQAQEVASVIEQIQFPATNGGNQLLQPDGLMIDTNGLWLEASNEAPYLGLRAHNTISGDNYQLLSTNNLSSHGWDLGQILNASDTQTDFTPVPMTNSMTFFWAHHANPAMEIYNSQYAIEPNPTNSDPGQVGAISIYNEGWATNDVAVYYTIGGTAQNGIDYSNLTGVAIVPLNQGYAEIDIDPIADGLKPDQTVILTLLQNTNYLIDPVYYSATNNLQANPELTPQAFGNTLLPCPNELFNLTLNTFSPDGLPLTYTILTWPTHGTLDTNGAPYVTYTPTNCYEGQDSFTFKVNDGYFDSAPATVTLTISDPVYANPAAAQTCRGGSAGFTLYGADNCGGTFSYAMLSNPAYGTVTNVSGQPTDPNYVYTCNGTNFTGADSFNYLVYTECGDSATGTVTVTVGDTQLYPNGQSVMTGTNRPVAVTLSAVDYLDNCKTDTDYYTYTVTSGPTNGTLGGSGANLTYTPTNGEGMDSFQFSASDGVWTSSYPATVTLYVVAGPILTASSVTCYPFGTAVQLDWNLDEAVSNMVQHEGLNISDFVIYRSTNSGAPYAAIYTTIDSSKMDYEEGNAVAGQTNYYVVTFESPSSTSSTNYESPASNETGVLGQNSDVLIPANAFWDVVTNLSDPTNVVRLQAPFSSTYPNQYPNQYQTLYPLPNSYWPIGSEEVPSVWSNHIVLYIPTNVVLSQVQYSIAIDNDYQLYLNNSSNYVAFTNSEGFATWSSLQSFTNIAPNLLHHGSNDVGVLIRDRGVVDYFSMVVTTNACGWWARCELPSISMARAI